MVDENLPPPTDYSQFTIEEIWDMVSPVDRISPAQLVAWNAMADLCADQADVLGRALVQLAEHWVPYPGSAAERFQTYMAKLVGYLATGHNDANGMSSCLYNIITTMDSATERMEPLVNAYRHYASVEESWRQAGLTGFYSGNPKATAPIQESPPANWQKTLHAQATQIMVETDAAMAAITAVMPKIELANTNLPHLGGAGTESGGSNGRSSLYGGFPGPAQPAPIMRPSLGSAKAPPSSTPPLAPVLAGVDAPPRSAAWPIGPESPNLGILAALTPQPPISAGLTLPNVALPVDGSTGAPNARETGEADGVSRSSPEESVVGRQGIGATPLMTTPAGGRTTQTARPAIRPGGRPALWASQRRRKESDPHDPWRVERGGPAVIEAPEPPVHDPGPGVIG
jgi:hypothetical protein